MIDALEALKRYKMSDYALSKTDALMLRISNGFLSFTLGELKNICLGLELILLDDPMNWKVNVLLHRLRSDLQIPRQL